MLASEGEIEEVRQEAGAGAEAAVSPSRANEGEHRRTSSWVWDDRAGRRGDVRSGAGPARSPSSQSWFPNFKKYGKLERQDSFAPNPFIDPLVEAEYGTTDYLGGWMRIGGGAWKRKVSMALICFLVLVGDANRGLVLPTLQGYMGKYGGDARDLGLANAGFSAGRLLAAPLFGYWMDRRNTGEVVLFSMILCALCNALYTYASELDVLRVNPTVIIVASRTALGFGASILGVGRAYIAKQTSKAERGPYIAILCALQYAGFTLTAFVSMIDFKDIDAMNLTKYNLPGFVLTVSYVVGIAALVLVPNTLFDQNIQHRTNRSRHSLTRAKYHNSSHPYLMQLEGKEEHAEASASAGGGGSGGGSGGGLQERLLGHSEEAAIDNASGRPHSQQEGDYSFLKNLLNVPWIVLIFILLNFTVRAVLATLETLSTYVISYLYTGSSDEKVWQAEGAPFQVALTFTLIGVGGLGIFGGVYYLSGHAKDRTSLLIGLSAILGGLCLTLDLNDGKGLEHEMSLARFQAGLALVWALGYPLSQTVVVSALSKVLTSAQQGIWMGNLASAGSAGRIVAPTLAGYAYNTLHEHTGLVPLAACCVLTALSIALVLSVWNKLKPQDAG